MLARHPSPPDGRMAGLAAGFQHVGRQRRLGHIIAPVERDLQRADPRIDHGGQPDRTGQEAPPCGRYLRLVMIARRTARAERLDIGEEAVDFVPFGVGSGFLGQFAGRRDEARQIPARRVLTRRKPLGEQIMVVRLARADEVAPQPSHHLRAHAVRVHSICSILTRSSLSLSRRASTASRNGAGQKRRP